MGTIDTRPQTVDISHYAGDTLTIQVLVSDGLAEGKVWKAQVKRDRESGIVDAEFAVIPIPGGADLVLSAEDSRALTQIAGALMAGRSLRGVSAQFSAPVVEKYSGVWDVEISDDGADPVITLAQGSLTIDMDVTRSGA